MNLSDLKGINWLKVLIFYGIILLATYIARKLPNLIDLLLKQISDISFSFNYNHGFATLIVSLLFYHFSEVNQEITLFGNKKMKSILFPVILLSIYSINGMSNNNGVDEHAWALIICFFALCYNIMEEYAWRGFLIENLGKTHYVIKSLISGIFWSIWHLLIFHNFDQYGGFWAFFAFCIIFSFILTFAVIRTKSLLVAATIHAFIIQMNIAALICFVIFITLLFTWNKPLIKENK